MRIKRFVDVLDSHGIRGGDFIYAVNLFVNVPVESANESLLRKLAPKWKILIKEIRRRDEMYVDRYLDFLEYEDEE